MRRIRKLLLGLCILLLLGVGVLAIMLGHDSACPSEPAALVEGESMLAIRAHCYGGSEVLGLERVAMPQPREDELLVRVHAAAVNPLDWHYLQGKPRLMRLDAGIGRPVSTSVGVDFAGTVQAVGSAVRDFKPGDAVFGSRRGSFAEYLVVRETSSVVRLPDAIAFEQAAATPIAALTALQALRDAGQVTTGKRVLINGASGGVGSFAVQIAKSLGAEVTGVSSARNAELVRSLGADHHIDYATEDFSAAGRRYDVIIDNVGNRSLADMRSALVEDGILVMVTGPKSNQWFGPLLRMLGAQLSAPFVSQTQVTLFAESNREDLAILRDMLEAGSLRAVIDRRFSLAEVPEAIEYLEQGRTRGKNVVLIDSTPVVP